jgi:Zn-dependent peptidase ImmA (M78 family)
MSSSPSNSATATPRLSGDRIDISRLRRGLSKAEVARQLGVTARTWSRYVAEGAPVRASAGLSSVLGMPAEFLTGGPLPALSVDEVNFRAGRRAAAVHQHAAVAAGTFGVVVDRWIDAHFSRPAWSAVDAHGLDDLDRSDPELAAQTVRLMWGLGEGPLPNLVQLCESRGIRVYGLPPLAEAVDAFSGWSADTPYIFLSHRKTPERSRFDVAHELGHLILHSTCAQYGKEPHGRQEEDADRFATEFLVPASAVSARLPRNPSVDQVLALRSTFRVSAMMTAKTALRGHRTNKAGYRRLCSALARRGFRTGEPGGMAQHERSRIFTHIFGSEAGPKQTSVADIAADTSLPVEDVHDLTFRTQVRVVPGPPPSMTNDPSQPLAPGASGSATRLRLVKG